MLVVGAVSHCGCAAPKSVSGWFGGEQAADSAEAPQAAGQPYYAAAEGLKVHSEPSGSSKVVGRLPLHEKVLRYKIERGYAYVKAERSGLAGWVNNAMLVWRLPSASPAPREPEAAAEPGGEEMPATPVMPSPDEAAAAPAGTKPPGASPTPSAAAPSLFDPY
jgi:hypothetical protein